MFVLLNKHEDKPPCLDEKKKMSRDKRNPFSSHNEL